MDTGRSETGLGWQDRDWAKWTDEERTRFLGTSGRAPRIAGPAGQRREITLLAMLVSLVVSVLLAHSHLFGWLAARPAHQSAQHVPAIVYGTGLAHVNGASQEMTCTAMATNAAGVEVCTAWTPLFPGQQAVQAAALPAGTSCPAVAADQHTGRWVCTTT